MLIRQMLFMRTNEGVLVVLNVLCWMSGKHKTRKNNLNTSLPLKHHCM